jgi:hypothetical protein
MFNKEVVTIFKYNLYAINKNLEGITHEESLVRPTAGNCINWILGHILFNRDSALTDVGMVNLCDKEFRTLYETEKKSFNESKALRLDKLLDMFNRSQELLLEGLLARDYKDDEEKTRNLIGLAFHEAYHAGQIGILRRFLGKPGKVE